MYRLFFAVFALAFCLSKPAAMASDYVVELGKPQNASLEVIGKKPPNRFIELDLGGLRTSNAKLPEGERDLKARIRLRNRRALERERAKPKAAAKKGEEVAKADSSDPEAEEAKENEKKAKPKKTKKKVKKKPKKKKKKKAKKSKKGKSSKTAKLDKKPTRPVKIE